MQLSQQGRPVDDVITALTAMRTDDVQWSQGRTFGLVYDGGPRVHEVAASRPPGCTSTRTR